MPHRKRGHAVAGVAAYYGLIRLLVLLTLIYSVFCGSDGIGFINSEDEENDLEDLTEVSDFQERNPLETNPFIRDLVLGANQLFEEEASNLAAEAERIRGNKDYFPMSADSVVVRGTGHPYGNSTLFEMMKANATVNSSSVSENKTSIKVECLLAELPEGEIPEVQLINGSMLLKIFSAPANNSTAGECSIVLFYSPYCVFSARAAPHFNALARVFPGVKCYAVDAMANGNLHMRYGLVAVPNVMLFHKGKPIARFNETHLNLEKLAAFVEKYTGLQYNGTLNVTSADMSGPVPSTLSKKVDYVLVLAWIFTICCMCYGFSKSAVCHRIVETVKRTWQEAEAQHEHED